MKRLKKMPIKRFDEFKSDWNRNQLNGLVMWASGGTPSKQVDLYWDGDIPWITASSMRGMEYNDSALKITRTGLENGSRLARKGSLLLLVRGSMLFNKIPIGIAARDLAFNQDVKSLTCKEPIIPRFLLYWFYASEHRLLSMVVGTGIGAGKLDLDDLKSMEVDFPSLQEQQKIAAFLAAVDDKIEQLTKKKVVLEQYKKCVMQMIFNKEIRFKDEGGSNYPDWGVHEFDKVYTFKGTNSYSRECLNYQVGSIKNIHYGDIHTKYRSLFKIESENVPFINFNLDVSKISHDNYCREGDIVITDASEDYAGIGKCIEIVSLNNQKVVAGLHNLLARPRANLVATGFAGYMMQSTSMRRQIHKVAQGSKVLSISSTRLGKLTFALPCLEEQTKIANFLSSLDDKIRHVDQQIELTKQYKKGLLQQMFV